jgi:hypothetical protein
METDLPTIILSYDVTMDARSKAARVSHLIFGRKDVKDDSQVPYVRRPGVVWIGQSVLIMPAPTAWELREKLRALGATVTTARIRIDRDDLQAFQRRKAEKIRKHAYGKPRRQRRHPSGRSVHLSTP